MPSIFDAHSKRKTAQTTYTAEETKNVISFFAPDARLRATNTANAASSGNNTAHAAFHTEYGSPRSDKDIPIFITVPFDRL
jgi:hypothetical protein